MHLIESVNSIFDWIISSSFKGSVVIILVLVLQVLFQRFLNARWRYVLWYLVIIRLILPFNFESKFSIYKLFDKVENSRRNTIGLKLPENGDRIKIVSQIEMLSNNKPMPINNILYQSHSPAQNIDISFLSIRSVIIIVWLVGILLFLFLLLKKYLDFQNLLKNAEKVTDSTLINLLQNCQKRLKLSHQIEILAISEIQSPLLYYKFSRPKILLPAHLLNSFTTTQWEAIFMHELVHHKRKDILVAWLTTFLQILHWMNPLIWLAFYRMRVDRELACDEFSLSVLGADKAKSYGQTIIALLENYKSKYPIALTIGILETPKALKRRMIMIKNFRSHSRWYAFLAIVLLIFSGFLTLSGAAGIELENKSYCKELNIQLLDNSLIQIDGNTLSIDSLAKFINRFSFDNNSIITFIPDTNLTQQVHFKVHRQLGQIHEFGAKIKYKNIKTGKMVVFPIYNFDDRMIPEPLTLKPLNVAGKYGYIRFKGQKSGETVIEPQFEDARLFSQFLAEVKLNNKWGFIDTTGQFVIEPKYEEIRFFHENLASVRLNGKWGVINRQGKMVVESGYDAVDFFHEEMAVVKLNGKSGFINPKGVIVIPLQFDIAWNFVNGLAAIKLNEKWGFIDRTGKIVIAPQFQEVGVFQDEYASVRINGLYGFIDRTGQVVIEPQFIHAEDFSEGLAAVQFPDYKFGFIDKSGKVVIEPRFDMAASFNMGCAIVTVFENPGKGVKGWGGCIDRAGNVIQNIRSK
ncbi:WG repeat-containing protein [candidate division KSB1 bacterium]|nr:WG repeat-containing protein [candidate division KSB1 bacterium]